MKQRSFASFPSSLSPSPPPTPPRLLPAPLSAVSTPPPGTLGSHKELKTPTPAGPACRGDAGERSGTEQGGLGAGQGLPPVEADLITGWSDPSTSGNLEGTECSQIPASEWMLSVRPTRLRQPPLQRVLTAMPGGTAHVHTPLYRRGNQGSQRLGPIAAKRWRQGLNPGL